MTKQEIEEAVGGYIDCALWSSSTGTEGGPEYFDELDADLSEESKHEMRVDCEDFIKSNSEDIALFLALSLDHTPRQVGVDFWLTRNGHGAGFWDRGAGDVGRRLSEASKAYGSSDVYVGDSGMIYCT